MPNKEEEFSVNKQSFSFESTKIAGLTIIHPFYAPDHRGHLCKTYEKSIFNAHGIYIEPFEELQSCSCAGTIRGLHFQRYCSQNKLVRVVQGTAFDVAVDLRQDSPTFGQWQSVYLTGENHTMFYIPKGFAHGFLALQENTIFSYLCGDRYDPESDGGIRWDDAELAIPWPVDALKNLIVSDKDQNLQSFSEFKQKIGALAYPYNEVRLT